MIAISEETIYLPNTIFYDLQQNIKSGKHIAFSYTYYYYISYLYRYCRYMDDVQKITTKEIKTQLGYSPNSKEVDYLIKKDGVLDEIGYTQSTTDYPVRFHLDEFQNIQFQTISEVKENSTVIVNDRNYKIKLPVKAFYTCQEAIEYDIKDGHYYDLHNTHGIPYSAFSDLMNNRELGTIGFYIYGYIKVQSYRYAKTHYGGFQRSLDNKTSECMTYDLKLSKKTISDALRILEINGYINVQHEDYYSNLRRKSMKANTYTAI